VIILRIQEPDLPRGFKVPGYPVTPVLSIAACAYILFSLHWYTWIAFSGWLTVALTYYLMWGRRHSALNGDGDGGTTAVARPKKSPSPVARQSSRRAQDLHTGGGSDPK